MSKLLFLFLLVFTSPLSLSSSTNHPIKLTSSEIKYNSKTKDLRVECKVFMDDFAPAISSSLLTSLNQSSLTNDDKKGIENYFTEKYKISINNNNFTWKIENFDISNNVLSLIFCNHDVTIKKGDQLKIENSLLFEVFGEVQSNWMTIVFPPQIRNYNFESVIEDPVYTKTF